jgi:hypothetical protein
LKQGSFTLKDSFSLKKVALAAASRDSLALYTKSTGRLRTGTFRGGRYAQVGVIAVRSGFTHAAASCDSLVLYDSVTGRTLVGTLVSGRLRHRAKLLLAPGWTRVVASCDTLLFGDHGAQDSFTGTLSGGDWTPVSTDTSDSFLFPLLQATASSWISVASNFGVWGPMGAGARSAIADADSFGPWDRIAGTARSILFYRADGTECRWTIVNGVAQDFGCPNAIGAGWSLIVGGR